MRYVPALRPLFLLSGASLLLLASGCGETESLCADDPCFAGVTCSETETEFVCGECPPGTEGDGVTCTEVDGCAESPCPNGVECNDVPAPGTGFTCGDCPQGTVPEGDACVEMDGCVNAPCFMDVACTDIPAPGTGFSCGDCPTGYEGDGETCTDVDACDNMPCFAGVICTDEAAPSEGFTCGNCPTGYEGDGITCTDIDGCSNMPCFAGVVCTDAVAPAEGFSCGDCPPGLEGDGETCTEIDGCAGMPCLPTTVCTDLPPPSDGFTCTPCVGATCPELRAQAGPDQTVVAGATVTLNGSAVGFNGSFSCSWQSDQGHSLSTCSGTVAVSADSLFTLTVTDASGLTDTDQMEVNLVQLLADAGPQSNINLGDTATLVGTFLGESCPGGACVDCAWALTDGTAVANTCTATVSPTATTNYVLTVTDNGANRSATDATIVYVVDQPAQLCGWNVVVMTSQGYATSANPNYTCDATGTARRQIVNSKPAIVLSDIRVTNARIVGHIGVETTGDDDLIGFLWGWQNPKQAYLLNWKQTNQPFGGCGNARSGISVKKIDGSTLAPDTISFNPSFGHNATDYVYTCPMTWSTDRVDEPSLNDNSEYLISTSDPGAFTTGWRDLITYRFEFFYTPTRTRVVVYEDDDMDVSTGTIALTQFDVNDSSYPEGAFAFFSSSQEQVAFGDFTLASLNDYGVDVGPDQTVSAGSMVTLSSTVTLAVPPHQCEWAVAGSIVGNECNLTVSPVGSAVYDLIVTDGFGRVASDQVRVTVAP